MTIDCYGYPIGDSRFQKEKRSFYELTKDGTFTYFRFSKEDVGAIHRLEEVDASNSKLTWAYGSWNGKSSLTFDTDLNTAKTI